MFSVFEGFLFRLGFFTVKRVIHRNNLPTDVVETPLMEVFKMRLGRLLDNLTEAPLPAKGWAR